MPSVPTRRQFLRASGLTLGSVLAGCTSVGYRGTDRSATPTASGMYADVPDGPESYPDRPDELTAEAVTDYVRAFERARNINMLHEPNVETLQVDCSAVHDMAAHGGHYALASCGGYANYADDVHADLGEGSLIYFVAPGLTMQITGTSPYYRHCTEVFRSSDSSENFAPECSGDDAAYQAFNFHSENYRLTASVEFLGGSGTTTVFERSYDMTPASGAIQHGVTYRRGVYRLRASVDNGPELRHRWELQSAPDSETPRLSILITPTGGLTVHRFPRGQV